MTHLTLKSLLPAHDDAHHSEDKGADKKPDWRLAARVEIKQRLLVAAEEGNTHRGRLASRALELIPILLEFEDTSDAFSRLVDHALMASDTAVSSLQRYQQDLNPWTERYFEFCGHLEEVITEIVTFSREKDERGWWEQPKGWWKDSQRVREIDEHLRATQDLIDVKKAPLLQEWLALITEATQLVQSPSAMEQSFLPPSPDALPKRSTAEPPRVQPPVCEPSFSSFTNIQTINITGNYSQCTVKKVVTSVDSNKTYIYKGKTLVSETDSDSDLSSEE